jgi:hydrogenase maturation factor
MLKAYTSFDERVKVGPAIGEDAAAVDMGDRYLLLKTDPITFVAEDIGTYTVRINANDIALWAESRCGFASILLPENTQTNL